MSSEVAFPQEQPAQKKRNVRNRDVPLDKAVIRERIKRARIMNQMTSVEAARRMGYSNSAQLSLMESGQRPIPNDWMFIKNMAGVYRCSVDYLLGLSPNPERDPLAAEGYAMANSLEELLQRQVLSLTTAFIKSGMHNRMAADAVQSLIASGEKIGRAVKALEQLNPEAFEDLRGGATLMRALEELDKDMASMRKVLEHRKAHDAALLDLANGKAGPMTYLEDRNTPSLELDFGDQG